METLKDLKSQGLVLSTVHDVSRCSSHFVMSRNVLSVTVGKVQDFHKLYIRSKYQVLLEHMLVHGPLSLQVHAVIPVTITVQSWHCDIQLQGCCADVVNLTPVP